ncbi:MAG: lytic transglycosylase domain-containing protein [Aestuariivirga sp.]
MARWLITSLAVLMATSAAFSTTENRQALATRICASAEENAIANGLEPTFFARLLWRESLFDPNVVSDKGAQGIAQFMPETAAERGLVNPFEPIAAVKASAVYLAELKKRFGNIGLAAAAYNAGEMRVEKWLSGQGGLPGETQDYVAFITGHQAEEWKAKAASFPVPAIGESVIFIESCMDLALRKGDLPTVATASAPMARWGALLAVNFSEARAVAVYRRLKLRFPAAVANRDPLIIHRRNLSRGTRRMTFVMLGENSRTAAETRCAELNAAAAPCIVRKN